MDRWRLAGIHSGKSIRRSRDREQPAFPWSWDSWISIRPKVIIISGKRNRGTKFFFHTSKNEIQLRGLTYSGVSKRGRLILLASSLGNNTRICSTYVIGNRKCVFFHTFSCLESFKIIEFIALHSSRWVQWRSKIDDYFARIFHYILSFFRVNSLRSIIFYYLVYLDIPLYYSIFVNGAKVENISNIYIFIYIITHGKNVSQWWRVEKKDRCRSLISQPLKFLRNGSVTRESCQVLH